MPEERPTGNDTVISTLLAVRGATLTTAGGACRGLTRPLRAALLRIAFGSGRRPRAQVTWAATILRSEVAVTGAFDRNFPADGIDEPNPRTDLDRANRRDRNRDAIGQVGDSIRGIG